MKVRFNYFYREFLITIFPFIFFRRHCLHPIIYNLIPLLGCIRWSQNTSLEIMFIVFTRNFGQILALGSGISVNFRILRLCGNFEITQGTVFEDARRYTTVFNKTRITSFQYLLTACTRIQKRVHDSLSSERSFPDSLQKLATCLPILFKQVKTQFDKNFDTQLS